MCQNSENNYVPNGTPYYMEKILANIDLSKRYGIQNPRYVYAKTCVKNYFSALVTVTRDSCIHTPFLTVSEKLHRHK